MRKFLITTQISMILDNAEIDVDVHLHQLWAILTEEEKVMVKTQMQIHSFKKNEKIYREGEIPTQLMCLLQGQVKIFKEGIGGRNQIMRLMQPVQYFGYRAYFAEENYVTEAAAVDSACVALIPMDLINQLIGRNRKLAHFFIKELAIDLGASDERTVNLTQKHIRGRLADSLVFLLDKYGTEQDGVTLNMCLAREDLANLSNMTTSNAIRTLSSFSNEGLINVDGRRIKILDEEQLRRINKFG